jgi:amino acid permease
MNWKLVFQLSLFGLAMAIATVFWVPSTIEPVLWLLIFLVCAYIIARKSTGRYFSHGFMVSIFNCVWITGAHVLLSTTYLARHPEELAQMNKMPMTDPRIAMLIVGPFIGIVSGLVLGLFSYVASKLVRKGQPGV